MEIIASTFKCVKARWHCIGDIRSLNLHYEGCFKVVTYGVDSDTNLTLENNFKKHKITQNKTKLQSTTE